MRRMLLAALFVCASVGVFVAGRNMTPIFASTSGDESQASAASISEAEYTAAFDAYLECATAAGFHIEGPVTRDRNGKLGASLVRPADGVDLQAAAAQVEECRAGLNDIELAWVNAHPPSSADFVTARNLTASCLVEAGIPIALSPSREELSAVIVGALVHEEFDQGTVIACLTQTAETLDWPGYGGG